MIHLDCSLQILAVPVAVAAVLVVILGFGAWRRWKRNWKGYGNGGKGW